MGRHLAPEEPPPPKDKPRYRFLVAISGILALAFAAMAVVNAVFPEKSPQAVAGPDPGQGANPFPEVPGPPGGMPSATPDPAVTAPPSAPPTTGPPPGTTAQPPPNPPSGLVSGAYSVPQTPWPDGFIGSVRLTNNGTSAESWQVVLVFPGTVGALQNRWISDGPGGSTVTRNGQTVVFNSTQVLAAGASIGLYFQFARAGADIDPEQCWVNGRACT